MATHSILHDPNCELSKEDQVRLQRIGPRLDATATVVREALDVIIKNRHFQLFIPYARGGLDYPLVRGMKIIEAYSYIEGNLGWIVQIGAGGGIFAAYLDEKVSHRFLGRPDQVIAGSDFIGGTAEQTTDGYRVKGEWRYASGALHATAFTGNCRIVNGIHAGQTRAVIVPADRVQIIKNWNAMGMRATDSHGFRLDQVVIPDTDIFDLDPTKLKVVTRTARLPFLLYARALFLPVLTGIASCFLELYREHLGVVRAGSENPARVAMETLDKKVTSCRKRLFDLAHEVWQALSIDDISGKVEVQNEEFRQLSVRITQDLLVALDACHWHIGMKGIRMDEPLNVAYRNFKTAAAHHLLRP